MFELILLVDISLTCGLIIIFLISFFSFNYSAYKNKTGKMRTPVEAIRPLIPFVFFLSLFFIWVNVSPNNIIETDPRVVFMLSGTIFSNISVSYFIYQFCYYDNGH